MCVGDIFLCFHNFLFRTTIALMGKFFAAGNFSVVYMYTAEIYPTVIRYKFSFPIRALFS